LGLLLAAVATLAADDQVAALDLDGDVLGGDTGELEADHRVVPLAVGLGGRAEPGPAGRGGHARPEGAADQLVELGEEGVPPRAADGGAHVGCSCVRARPCGPFTQSNLSRIDSIPARAPIAFAGSERGARPGQRRAAFSVPTARFWA